MGNSSTVRLMVELFPIFYTSNQNLTFRKIGNSSTISLTVELFPIYAFELFTHFQVILCNTAFGIIYNEVKSWTRGLRYSESSQDLYWI